MLMYSQLEQNRMLNMEIFQEVTALSLDDTLEKSLGIDKIVIIVVKMADLMFQHWTAMMVCHR
jgi:hypothetical protein